MPKNAAINRIPTAVSALLRLIFIVVFGVTGFLLAREADLHLISLHVANGALQQAFGIATPILGALLGVAVAPHGQRFFEHELTLIEDAAQRLSPFELLGATGGLCTGLVVALLIRGVLGNIVGFVGLTADAVVILLSTLLTVCTSYIGLRVGGRDRGTLNGLLLLDTSAIIDGRILDIFRSGFLEGEFIVPRFVLGELQAIADASDAQRRARGRRGLELLNTLRHEATVRIDDANEGAGLAVDARLVRIARERGARLITTDFNLNRVAQVEGVRVLNVNELSQALKRMVQTGQELTVMIVREGREPEQGIAYLDDGTMLIIEHGREQIGKACPVVVTSVLQTAAGRLLFARPR